MIATLDQSHIMDDDINIIEREPSTPSDFLIESSCDPGPSNPKIELLPDPPAPLTKRDPFATKKATTVKRDAKQVYKGLNKPDFIPETPLDQCFLRLEKLLCEAGSLSSLMAAFSVTSQYALVEAMFSTLEDIQSLSLAAELPKEDLMAISMHDLKTFSKLVNCIIIYGVYPALTRYSIGIPFEKRNLASFTTASRIASLETDTESEAMLTLIYDRLLKVLTTPSDVRDLLARGTGYSDLLVVALALSTIPTVSPQAKRDVDVDRVMAIPELYEVYQTLTLLMATPLPSYFRQAAMAKLQRLPFDFPNGVKTLIEFVLGLREHEEVQVDKFEYVASVLLAKPRGIPTVEYFSNILTSQCYDLLININRPVITSCVGFVIQRLWDRNPHIVQDFLLKKIWSLFNPGFEGSSSIVKVEALDVLVGEAALNNNLNVLISLSKKVTDPALLKAIFQPIVVAIWGYLSFLAKRKKPTEVVMNLLVSYFTSTALVQRDEISGLDDIAKNLIFEGDGWRYLWGPNGLTEIRRKVDPLSGEDQSLFVQKFLDGVDAGCTQFVELMASLDDEKLITSEFLIVLKRWLNISQTASIGESNPFVTLVDLKLVEAMGEKFGDVLCESPEEMLQVVDDLLATKPIIIKNNVEAVDSDDEDEEMEDATLHRETVAMVLQLLSAIIAENADFDDNSRKLLVKIQSQLRLTYSKLPASASLIERIEEIEERKTGSNIKTTQHQSEAKILKRAIANLSDPLVPIRAHGLYLLRQLIQSESEVIDVPIVVQLHLLQLLDPEPFVYLNAIKGLESLLEMDTLVVLQELCLLYVADTTAEDVNSEKEGGTSDLDQRLRIGEVLLRYIQGAGPMFTNESSALVVGSALKVVEHTGEDDRMRMSAMSLLGTCCKTNPIGFVGLLPDAIECALGVLLVDQHKDKAIVRRAAIVMLHDLILGTSDTDAVPFPQQYMQRVYTALDYIRGTDNDLLVREQAQLVLETIKELSLLAWDLLKTQENDKFAALRI